jgi:NADH dehydrogenase
VTETHVVTGAFGFTGRHIARRLLEAGRRVATLTGKPMSVSPFGDRIEAHSFDWDDPARLAETLRGASVLYNTYWVRFDWGDESYDRAVANTRVLFRAAKEAGVRRVVHVSITNPSEDSPFPYFRGKAVLERELRESGLSHAILRPAVVFGPGDVLINNIAWIVRRFPFFVVPGRGDYRLQPVFVDDLAALAVDAGRRDDDFVLDAIGPDTFAFEELVRLVARTLSRRTRIVHASPRAARGLTGVLGKLVNDVVLTRDEIEGLMADLLVTSSPPAGPTKLGDWLAENAQDVGRRYASELARHFRPMPTEPSPAARRR